MTLEIFFFFVFGKKVEHLFEHLENKVFKCVHCRHCEVFLTTVKIYISFNYRVREREKKMFKSKPFAYRHARCNYVRII